LEYGEVHAGFYKSNSAAFMRAYEAACHFNNNNHDYCFTFEKIYI